MRAQGFGSANASAFRRPAAAPARGRQTRERTRTPGSQPRINSGACPAESVNRTRGEAAQGSAPRPVPRSIRDEHEVNCRNCTTRVSPQARRCPNCGCDIEADPLQTAELELEDAVSPAPAPPRGRAGAIAQVEPKARPQVPTARLAAFTLRPAEIRTLVAATPEVIERGLRVYQGAGGASGAGFSTAVGEIDLLAQDEAGGLAVVMVAESEPSKEFLLELLQRIGFVRTHVAKTGQEVRGILLVERLSDPTRYTIAALGGTVSVKSWRVALSFEELRV